MPPTRPTTAVLVARTILWIVLSSLFLVRNLNLLHRAQAAGQANLSWLYIQLALWSFALIFWLYTGWRDWTRRPTTPPNTPAS